MRGIKMHTLAAVTLATAGLGATSAQAANWDPVNTNFASSGTYLLHTNGFGTVDCQVTETLRSTGNDLATSTAPPVFDNCSSNIAGPVTVTTIFNWTLTATSTTAVDRTVSMTANIGGGLCVITMSAAIVGNTWSNTAHTLTLNSGQSFPITEHGFCDGGTSGSLSGTSQFATSANIT
jgi:hypothetical protein